MPARGVNPCKHDPPNFEVCIEALTELGPIFSPGGLHIHRYLKILFLGGSSKASGKHIPGTGKGVKSLRLLGAIWWVNQSSYPLANFPQYMGMEEERPWQEWEGDDAMLVMVQD